MRRLFSLGALTLILSGSALAPAIPNRALAATRETDPQVQSPGADLAIRDSETVPTPEELAPTPPASLPIAPVPTPSPRVVRTVTGQASWYGPGFYGNRTANGEVLRRGTLTAAHRYLPFGTKVRVTNLNNGRTAVVRINDRGPFHGSRVIDLAHGAASNLGLVSSGVASVKLEVLQ